MLDIGRFGEFYEALHDGRKPFPWQERLAKQVHADGWPRLIDLPTGFGKTSVLEIAVFLAAIGSDAGRRRIFFVVDRRVVVDAASEMAEGIAKKLREAEGGVLLETAEALRGLGQAGLRPPLRTFTLRGGIFRDAAWACDPLQAQICCTTVDQVGSALLFRGYSARSNYSWPIQAAMTAYDSLLFLDEAHLSKPFEQTARIIENHYLDSPAIHEGRKLVLTSLTATATSEASTVFRHGAEDLQNERLQRRFGASKSVTLIKSNADGFDKAAIAQTLDLAKSYQRIAVIVNRVDSARAIFSALANNEAVDSVLFTGRSRPYERNQIAARYLPVLRSESKVALERPLIAVATQCLEAGADFDFDAMVTECASWDALRQRWGRLNRLGDKDYSPCVVILRSSKSDPIYGDAMKETFDWIGGQMPEKKGKRDIPTFDASPANLSNVLIDPEQLGKMLQPKREAPVLLPAYLDHLVHTSPEPEIEFDVPIFLHGAGSGAADLQIVWREGLTPYAPEEDWIETVALNPPSGAEMLALPVWRVKRWLQNAAAGDGELTDLEGQADPETKDGEKAEIRPFLIWRGDESRLSSKISELRPGLVLVLPVEYGGCDGFGWNPDSSEKVLDIGDEAAFELRRRPVLRLFQRPAKDEDFDAWLFAHEEASEGRNAILAQLRELKPRERRIVVKEDSGGEARVVALSGPRIAEQERHRASAEVDIEQEGDASSFTAEEGVELNAHLDEVWRRAQLYCERLGVPEAIGRAIMEAARFHDIGKADPRFQALLQGRPLWAAQMDRCLAKSARSFGSAQGFLKAREAAKYPAGGRHELLSTAMLAAAAKAGQWTPDDCDLDLVLHLVASHHGRCRPFAPFIADGEPEVAEFEKDGVLFHLQTDHDLADWGSGVADRFWKLHSECGWYGVAYMESLLRLADQRVSEEGK